MDHRRVNVEKVKVTQEQADWLDKYSLTQAQIDHYIDIQPLNLRPDSPISDWKPSKLARALYKGYEVEDFEIGDWVYIAKEGMYGQKPQVTMVTGLKEQKYISFPLLEVD